MTVEPYGHWMGDPMDVSDIEDLLRTIEWGVLSVADGDVPYTIPMTFGYDGEDVYFGFVGDSPTNEKFNYVGEGKTARLLVTDVRSQTDWRSVSVTGPLRMFSQNTDRWERMRDLMGENTWFTAGYDRVRNVERIQGWRLVPEDMHGLELNIED